MYWWNKIIVSICCWSPCTKKQGDLQSSVSWILILEGLSFKFSTGAFYIQQFRRWFIYWKLHIWFFFGGGSELYTWKQTCMCLFVSDIQMLRCIAFRPKKEKKKMHSISFMGLGLWHTYLPSFGLIRKPRARAARRRKNPNPTRLQPAPTPTNARASDSSIPSPPPPPPPPLPVAS